MYFVLCRGLKNINELYINMNEGNLKIFLFGLIKVSKNSFYGTSQKVDLNIFNYWLIFVF